jgi:uridine kinase
LMDATVATGAAAMMAIRVLLDHDVPEENILVASLLMAASGNQNWKEIILIDALFFCFYTGVHSIAYAFPRVRIVSSAVDPEINEKFFVKPGIGNFGDRYFGTGSSIFICYS